MANNFVNDKKAPDDRRISNDIGKPKRITNRLEKRLYGESRYAKDRFIFKHLKNKKVLMILTIMLIVGASLTLYFTKTNKNTNNRFTNNICYEKSPVFKNINEKITNSDTKGAKKIAERILTDPNHEENIDCLTAVIEYYLLSSDSVSAEEYMKKLIYNHKKESKLDPSFSKIGLNTAEDVENHVKERVKQRKKQYESTLFPNAQYE